MAERRGTKHGVSVISWKKRRRSTAKVRSEKVLYRSPFFTVSCDKHGKDQPKNTILSWLRVGEPRNKRERRAGCPKCKKERNG